MGDQSNRTNQRKEARHGEFGGKLHGSLMHAQSERPLDARPIDVSSRGLGILVNEYLESGSRLILEMDGQRFLLEVIYCHQHLGMEQLYRVGLFLRNADGDLAETFKKLEWKNSSDPST